jgi:hypothetical protein
LWSKLSLLVLKIAEGVQQQKKRIVMPLQAEGAQQQICDGSVRMVMMSTSKDSCCTTEMK